MKSLLLATIALAACAYITTPAHAQSQRTATQTYAQQLGAETTRFEREFDKLSWSEKVAWVRYLGGKDKRDCVGQCKIIVEAPLRKSILLGTIEVIYVPSPVQRVWCVTDTMNTLRGCKNVDTGEASLYRPDEVAGAWVRDTTVK